MELLIKWTVPKLFLLFVSVCTLTREGSRKHDNINNCYGYRLLKSVSYNQ